jgi:hypothetical protein
LLLNLSPKAPSPSLISGTCRLFDFWSEEDNKRFISAIDSFQYPPDIKAVGECKVPLVNGCLTNGSAIMLSIPLPTPSCQWMSHKRLGNHAVDPPSDPLFPLTYLRRYAAERMGNMSVEKTNSYAALYIEALNHYRTASQVRIFPIKNHNLLLFSLT